MTAGTEHTFSIGCFWHQEINFNQVPPRTVHLINIRNYSMQSNSWEANKNRIIKRNLKTFLRLILNVTVRQHVHNTSHSTTYYVIIRSIRLHRIISILVLSTHLVLDDSRGFFASAFAQTSVRISHLIHACHMSFASSSSVMKKKSGHREALPYVIFS